MIIVRDLALRAHLAGLVRRGGYRAEIVESVTHAQRRRLKGIVLGIVAAKGLDAEEAVELRAALGEVLLVAETDGRAARDADVIDISERSTVTKFEAAASKLIRAAWKVASISRSAPSESSTPRFIYLAAMAAHYTRRAGHEPSRLPQPKGRKGNGYSRI